MSALCEAVAAELARIAQRAAKQAERAAVLKKVDEPAKDADAGESTTTCQDSVQEPVILSPKEVDAVLTGIGVPTSGAPATPVQLRATRIHFSGVKVLRESHSLAGGHGTTTPVGGGKSADVAAVTDLLDSGPRVAAVVGADDDEQGVAETVADLTEAMPAPPPAAEGVPMVELPFEWTWEPQLGVNGIGSGKNLRGKSTVLNVLMWALSGRCANFQVDVKAWLRHVEVDWQVGGEALRVRFENDNGHAVGAVESIDRSGAAERVRAVGVFDGEEAFEDVMGSVMMSRLRLEEIPVWTVDRKVRHKWPAYASALTVRADMLDPVVGNVTVLGARMLQMFVGTDWGPALAATQTALNELRAERSSAVQRVTVAGEVIALMRENARAEVARLDAELKSIPAGTPDVEQLLGATAVATELARRVHELERQLMDAASQVDTLRLQLRSARARTHTQLEDALAIKFFHQMTPSVCPRCTARVTSEQQAAEAEKHECSLCSKVLALETLDVSNMVAEQPSIGDVEAPVDDVSALEAAMAAADLVVASLNSEITAAKDQLATAEGISTSGDAQFVAAEDRRRVELALARAEGALEALENSSDTEAVDTGDHVAVEVLEAANRVLSNWMKGEQNPLLARISADIEKLAVGFGADSLSGVKLGGGGRLDVMKGGEKTTFTGLTAGEKLRVKIATAVALIKHGYVARIGRHPGFLVLDSPAAEEMPEEDLAILMAELVEVAKKADMQVFVGTRNAEPLIDLLPAANRRVAVGDDFLW